LQICQDLTKLSSNVKELDCLSVYSNGHSLIRASFTAADEYACVMNMHGTVDFRRAEQLMLMTVNHWCSASFGASSTNTLLRFEQHTLQGDPDK